MGVATLSSRFLPFSAGQRERKDESRIEKHHAEDWANDMDVKGTPCQCRLQWWQETWETTSRPFKFWGESWGSDLLWGTAPSWNLSCAALSLSLSLSCSLSLPLYVSRSEVRLSTDIKNCLLCLSKYAIPSYFPLRALAKASIRMGSRSHRGFFDMRKNLHDKQLLACVYNAYVSIYPHTPKPLYMQNSFNNFCTAWHSLIAQKMHSELSHFHETAVYSAGCVSRIKHK